MSKKAKKSIDTNKVDAVFNEILMTGKQLYNGKDKEVDRQEEGKTISIGKLPNGWPYFERLRLLVKDQDIAKICVIALKINEKQWQAYAGYPALEDLIITLPETFEGDNWIIFCWNCEYIRSAQQVKMLGEVLPKEIALQMFPDWEKDKYKERGGRYG